MTIKEFKQYLIDNNIPDDMEFLINIESEDCYQLDNYYDIEKEMLEIKSVIKYAEDKIIKRFFINIIED
jgi:hypothetical protein